ncbi:MAG: hypothetical protein GY947_01015 [Rhodobacteraceae bacterium]|nr:hypothetical protein [Paracoccaceae bacterium]
MSQDMKTFQKRLKFIEKSEKGGFFSRRDRGARRGGGLPMIRMLLFFALTYCALTAAKITMEKDLGVQGYNARLVELSSGDEAAKIAAILMKRDRFMGFVKGYL